MKKIYTLLLAAILLVSGCSSSTKADDLRISKWMFDYTLESVDVEKKLGASSGTNDMTIIYNDWELCDGISGTLSFRPHEEDNAPFAISWSFSAQMDEKQYESLHEKLKSAYKEIEHQLSHPESGTVCVFLTTFDFPDTTDRVYSLVLREDDGMVTLTWGGEWGAKKLLEE